LFAHNVATLDGGAIDNANESSGDVSITDTTFAENSASADGGAIANASHGSGSMDVTSSTFAANAASTASALDNAASGTGSMLLTADLLVSSVGPACAGTISDGGYNVADTSSCVFSAHSSVNDSSSIDGYVSPLGLYGGPTETVALLGVSTAAGSSSDPALGRVSSTALVPSNTESVCSLGDQRGEPRSTTCDAGAFELHASHGILGTPAVVLARAPNTISLTITPPPGLPATFPDLAGWSAPSGEVSVSDGASSCTTTLTSSSNGLASCRLSGLRLGASMVRVSYAGDENFTPWSLTKRVVARSGTSATLTLSARSVVHGKENHERFSVHVRAAAGAGTPDGSVHVMAGTTTLCSLTLVAGVGVCSPSSARVAASTYMVTAVYPGTSTWAPSHSSSENWKVTP
jgi:predicted outer membrane repeat protein